MSRAVIRRSEVALLMPPEYALTRSSANLRLTPDPKAPILHALDAQDHLLILDEAESSFLVQATRWRPPLQGYVLKSSVLRACPAPQVFPRIDLGKSILIPSVPESVPLSNFLVWLNSAAESPWLPAGYLDAIQRGQRPSAGGLIRQAISERAAPWDEWVAEIKAQGREGSCPLDEWLAVLAGGREMWSFRTERIFSEASQHSPAPAWVMPTDVLRWTGHAQVNNGEPKYKLWYQVEFTKLDGEFKGWYKADLLHEFVFPSPEADLSIAENRNKVFDLSRPALRLPADPEFDDARRAGRVGAQYIDIRAALGSGLVQHNLCGQLCVAALIASDIIPLLQDWLRLSTAAREILARDRGTTTLDVEAMLRLVGKKYEFFRATPGIAPLTPEYLRKNLEGGRMAIALTGVTATGVVRSSSRILHWVVIEDFLPVANSGWVRLYNPFPNREEVYPLQAVFNTTSRSTIGLWVEPNLPRLLAARPRPLFNASPGPDTLGGALGTLP